MIAATSWPVEDENHKAAPGAPATARSRAKNGSAVSSRSKESALARKGTLSS